jgi:hypothetical protein
MNNAAKVTMKKIAGVIAVASMLSIGAVANAEVLTFDTLSGSLSTIPNGYGGLQWSNFGSHSSSTVPGSGYETGTVSGLNASFNLGGNPASFSSVTEFSLNSAYFTSAWNEGLQIHVVATGGSNTYISDFTVDTSGPLNVFFNWSNINSVSFFSSGGVPNPDLANTGMGTHFVMDNLAINENVSPVPEPETYAMLLIGLCLFGFVARRRVNFSY